MSFTFVRANCGADITSPNNEIAKALDGITPSLLTFYCCLRRRGFALSRDIRRMLAVWTCKYRTLVITKMDCNAYEYYQFYSTHKPTQQLNPFICILTGGLSAAITPLIMFQTKNYYTPSLFHLPILSPPVNLATEVCTLSVITFNCARDCLNIGTRSEPIWEYRDISPCFGHIIGIVWKDIYTKVWVEYTGLGTFTIDPSYRINTRSFNLEQFLANPEPEVLEKCKMEELPICGFASGRIIPSDMYDRARLSEIHITASNPFDSFQLVCIYGNNNSFENIVEPSFLKSIGTLS